MNLFHTVAVFKEEKVLRSEWVRGKGGTEAKVLKRKGWVHVRYCLHLTHKKCLWRDYYAGVQQNSNSTSLRAPQSTQQQQLIFIKC